MLGRFGRDYPYDRLCRNGWKKWGLTNQADQMPTNISGGMRKRVGLARALALEPPLETGAPAGTNETLRRATVTIDGLPANMHYSGTAPGFVCLYQIDAPVPQEARIGDDILLFIEIGGRLNNVVTIALAP